MNPWAWTDRNPYYSTAFQILDLDPTVRSSASRSRITARRNRIEFGAARFPLFGRILTVAEINAAEAELSDPESRLSAELLTHRPIPHDPEIDALTELFEIAEEQERQVSRVTPADGDNPDTAPRAIRLDPAVLVRLLTPANATLGETKAPRPFRTGDAE